MATMAAAPGGSQQVVPLLLNFIKEGYLKGRDAAIVQMLWDISSQGGCPRELARWGILDAGAVNAAVQAYHQWLAEGRPFMSGRYETSQGEMRCCVINGNAREGTVNLIKAPSGKTVKLRADPEKVSPAPFEGGWFVPDLPGQQMLAPAPATNGAASMANGFTNGAAHHTATSGCAAGAVAASPPVGGYPQSMPATRPGNCFLATSRFDAEKYGSDYLPLFDGDMVEFLREEDGWAFGLLVQSSHTPVGTQGWYPPNFVKRCNS